MKKRYILDLNSIDRTMLELAGGKAANLGELSNIEGIHVPGGFCVITKAYAEITAGNPFLETLLNELDLLEAGNRKGISEISAKIRKLIEEATVPEAIRNETIQSLEAMGEGAFAVRSSATAEDLPGASFAGQQESYLNILKDKVLPSISKCWASLFTDRAVTYRIRNGFDHRKVKLAVVVQKMIFPQVSGILFTADPVTGNRKVMSVDASFGLGEALVSGIVNADVYKIRDGSIIDKKVAGKKKAIYALKEGGTREEPVEAGMQEQQALTDDQIIQLANIGKIIETHFGYPQDIEWCVANGDLYIVQSRPITTLYPIPEAKDNQNHVYISVGHQQMMTDAMTPLGLSFYLLLTPAPMRTAGGRLFVDVTQILASPERRRTWIDMLGKSEPLMKDALLTLMKRENFIKPVSTDI